MPSRSGTEAGRRARPLGMPALPLALLAVLVAGAATAPPASAFSPTNSPTGDISLVGSTGPTRIDSAARSGDTLFLGGTFTGIGRRATRLAAFDPVSADLVGPKAHLDRLGASEIDIRAIEPAADGGVYIAGLFGGSDGVPQSRLLRLTPDGELDPAFAPSIVYSSAAGSVTEMALSPDGRTLYIGGNISSVGGARRHLLAAVDALSGAVRAWRPDPDQLEGDVRDLEAGPIGLYVAGLIKVNGESRSGVAALSLSDGTPLAWDPQPAGGASGVTAQVADIAVADGTVYLAGDFTSLRGNTERRYLAAVEAGGAGAATAWSPRSNNPVEVIAVHGGTVYAAGEFSQIGASPQARVRLGAVDAATGQATPWNPGLTAPNDPFVRPKALLAVGDSVYLGFDSFEVRVGGQSRCAVAAVSASGAGTVRDWDPRVARAAGGCTLPQRVDGSVLAVSAGRIWVGGGAQTGFEVAGVLRRTGLAAVDVARMEILPWAPRLVAATGTTEYGAHDLAVAPDGTKAYIGGQFAFVNGEARRNAAAVGTIGTGDLMAWNPSPDGVVRAVVVTPDARRVYLGGAFGTIGGGWSRSRVAAVDPGTGGLHAAFNARIASGTIWDLAPAPEGRLLLAGTFSALGAPLVTRHGIAEVGVDGVATAWNANLAGGAVVLSAAHDGERGRVFAGGTFSVPGGSPNVGAFAATDGARVPWYPQSGGADAPPAPGAAAVQRVAVDPLDGTVYLAGQFSRLGTVTRTGLASVTADGVLTEWNPGPAPTETTGRPLGGVVPLPDATEPARHRIVATGSFTGVGGEPRAGIAFFGSALPPTPRVAPAVTGSPDVGSTLRCSGAEFGGSPGTATYEWLRDDADTIATAESYTVDAADLGHSLRCRVTMANAAGRSMQTSLPLAITPRPPELQAAPAVTGELWPGGTARCTTGLWRGSPTSHAVRWLVDGAVLAGATTAEHVVGAPEVDHQLACEVTATNAAGDSAPARSTAVTVTEPPPVNTGAPRIVGSTIVGSTLTCDAGAWLDARQLSYQWLRDGVAVAGARAVGFVATSRDVGRELRCAVTAANRGGNALALSAPVVVVPGPHSTGFTRRTALEDVGATSTARLRVLSVRVVKRQRVEIKVSAPAAGRLTVTLAPRAQPRRVVARGTRRIGQRGTATVTVALTSRARALVRRGASMRIAVTLTRSARAPQLRATVTKSLRSR